MAYGNLDGNISGILVDVKQNADQAIAIIRKGKFGPAEVEKLEVIHDAVGNGAQEALTHLSKLGG
jgi:hypothetical protein